MPSVVLHVALGAGGGHGTGGHISAQASQPLPLMAFTRALNSERFTSRRTAKGHEKVLSHRGPPSSPLAIGMHSPSDWHEPTSARIALMLAWAA